MWKLYFELGAWCGKDPDHRARIYQSIDKYLSQYKGKVSVYLEDTASGWRVVIIHKLSFLPTILFTDYLFRTGCWMGKHLFGQQRIPY